jgi:sirohydrochlorin ferrochelatase
VSLLLVAHGSADPRAATATRALARAVGPAAHVSFLDHAGPRPDDVLDALAGAGARHVTVVPLLLTAAYHSRVDVPRVLDRAPAVLTVEVSDVLGPVGGAVPGLLLDGLCRRLAGAGGRYDAVVLAAAGTRDEAALSTVEQSARALGARLGLPCRAAYASASAPTAGAAVAALRAEGARRVAVAAYFLAPGRLYDAAVASARAAGAGAVATSLGDAPELVRLVRARAAAARPWTAVPAAA